MEKNIQKEEQIFKKPWVHSLISFIVIFSLLGVFLFWQTEKNTILVENSVLSAPASPGRWSDSIPFLPAHNSAWW